MNFILLLAFRIIALSALRVVVGRKGSTGVIKAIRADYLYLSCCVFTKSYDVPKSNQDPNQAVGSGLIEAAF
jgi:hypothetical protein